MPQFGMRRGLQDPKHGHGYVSLFDKGADTLAGPWLFPVQTEDKTTDNLHATLFEGAQRFQERVLDVVVFVAGFEHILIRRLNPDKNFPQPGRNHEVDHFRSCPRFTEAWVKKL